MNRTLGWTAGLAVTAAVALTGSTVAVGQAATTHHPVAHSSRPGRQGAVIRIHDFAFHTPASVGRGATVTVHNKDGMTHTVTSNGGLFGVRVPAHGTRTFRAPSKNGDYRFHCNIHTSMHGVLHVR
jgi:plastocyanin